MKALIFALAAVLLPGVVYAIPLGGAGRSLKSGSSMYGLCSQDTENVDSVWTKGQPNASYCQDIDSVLDDQKGCNPKLGRPGKYKLSDDKTIVEQLMDPNNPANKPFMDSLHEACGDKIDAIKSDPVKFKLFLKQLMAVLLIQENEWKSEPTSSMGAQGLGQLDPKSVAAYGKCSKACADLAKTKQTKGGQDHVGDHNNVKCTVAISLFYMGVDGTMGNGHNNNASYGIARYFQPFRNIDKKNRNGWMMPKLRTYCKDRIDQESNTPTQPEKSLSNT